MKLTENKRKGKKKSIKEERRRGVNLRGHKTRGGG
jgi:hypothetical protein